MLGHSVPSGQYQFGYADPYSNRAESKDIDGVVVGSYNYIDETGLPQTVQYVADEKGFHVTGSTIPVHNLEHPVPVQDTPEVVAAREAHLRQVLLEKLKPFSCNFSRVCIADNNGRGILESTTTV